MGLTGKVLRALRGRSVNRNDAGGASGASLVEHSLERVTDLEYMLHDLTSSILYSRWMESPNVLASRKETGYWLNWLELAGQGVEVGVFTGDFSKQLLRTWRESKLVSIDPWREFPTTEYVDTCNLSQAEHNRNYEITVEKLSSFDERSRVLRMTSEDAVSGFADASLSFVYLDAQHHYEAVRDDIQLWAPKLKPGGVLGGHDYLNGRLDSGLYGVKQAVDEFAAASGYDLIVTRERNWPSWFVRVG